MNQGLEWYLSILYINSLHLSVYDRGFGGWGKGEAGEAASDPWWPVLVYDRMWFSCYDASAGFVILQSDFSGRFQVHKAIQQNFQRKTCKGNFNQNQKGENTLSPPPNCNHTYNLFAIKFLIMYGHHILNFFCLF
jgi:hypothetical protein